MEHYSTRMIGISMIKACLFKKNYDVSDHSNILFIRNPIIMRGNAFKPQEKLTALLQDKIGKSPIVWPVAIGGWTQINEMVYLGRHPEIINNADLH